MSIPAYPKQLYIIRHGQTEGNIARCFTGWKDEPLTDLGHHQATAVAKVLKLAKIESIFSSQLVRTKQTATPLSGHLQAQINSLMEFNEREMGPFTGHRISQVFEKHPDFSDRVFHRPTNDLGVENTQDFVSRIRQGLAKVSAVGLDKVALFTHGGTIIYLLQELIPDIDMAEIEVANASITFLRLENNKYLPEKIADVSHL